MSDEDPREPEDADEQAPPPEPTPDDDAPRDDAQHDDGPAPDEAGADAPATQDAEPGEQAEPQEGEAEEGAEAAGGEEAPETDDGEAPADEAGAEPVTEGEEVAAEEAEAPEQEAEEEAEEEPASYDGLSSGLSWLGAEPFVPPVPAGYAAGETAVTEAAAVPRALGAERKLSVRERLEARRAEADATKRWYQKVPIPVWLCMPATLFIIFWILFVAKPWRHIPGPWEKVEASLATAPAVDDVGQALRDMGVVTMQPMDSWLPLGGGVLRTDGVRSARLTFEQPAPEGNEPAAFAFACEVAIVAFAPTLEYSIKVELDPAWALELRGNRREQQAGREARRADCYFQFCRDGRQVVGRPYQATTFQKLRWYRLRVAVRRGLAYYYVNGKRMGDAVLPAYEDRPHITIEARNAHVLVRNPRVELPN